MFVVVSVHFIVAVVFFCFAFCRLQRNQWPLGYSLREELHIMKKLAGGRGFLCTCCAFRGFFSLSFCLSSLIVLIAYCCCVVGVLVVCAYLVSALVSAVFLVIYAVDGILIVVVCLLVFSRCGASLFSCL